MKTIISLAALLVAFVIVIGLTQACGKAVADDKGSMRCDPLAFGAVENGWRCENSEATCFMTAQGGISCLKK